MLSFEEAIHLMTQVQAELYGLKERGVLREGWHADVIVIDPETVGTDEVAMQFDLPGDEGRLYAGLVGHRSRARERHRRSSPTASSPPIGPARCCARAATP